MSDTTATETKPTKPKDPTMEAFKRVTKALEALPPADAAKVMKAVSMMLPASSPE